MPTLIRIVLAVCAVASPAASDWGYYRGDIATFPASNTSAGVSESIHRAVETGLDWVVLSTPPGTGSFVGQNDIVEEIKLTVPRLTPILATGWWDSTTRARVLGVDSRAPIADNLSTLLATVRSHKGVAVIEDGEQALPGNPTITTFSPIEQGAWSQAVNPGDVWDRALTQGRRVFIASTSLATPPGDTHETTVWSEGNHADQIIEALREGSSYVSDRDGISLDFQVDGHTFGRTVFHEGEPFVRIRAYARHPISSVSLIADGVEVWSAEPNATVWEERFFLPASDYGYVRAVLHSVEGGYRTLGNPVFLVTERPADGELPIIDGSNSTPADDLIELGGIVEALAGLSDDAQTRILREFLSDATTRYGTCWLLQNRSDIVGDRLLAGIATSDPDVEARLGAAYALVTRGSDMGPDTLLGYLDHPDTRLQRYAARIFAHYTEGFTESDWTWNPNRDPESQAFLIRAYRPTRFEAQHIDHVLTALQSPDRVLSEAAGDKMVELGTRHYNVIEALLDATEAGQARAAETLALISDHRTVSRLKRIFDGARDPDLRRAVFLALDRMGAPYPGRRVLDLPSLDGPPRIDGIRSDSEWVGAVRLDDLLLDWDGRPAATPSDVVVGAWADSVYIHITRPLATDHLSATLTRTPETVRDNDETIELAFASPYGDADTRVERLTVNGLGVRVGGDRVNCNVVSRVTGSEWHVEMSIPARAVSERPWFNLSVVEAGSPRSRVTWSVTYGDPGNHSRFGKLLTGDLR